jgi:hypothetical protein
VPHCSWAPSVLDYWQWVRACATLSLSFGRDPGNARTLGIKNEIPTLGAVQ